MRHLSGSRFEARDGVGHMDHVHLISSLFAEDAAENLLEALAKVLRHQGVNDRVEAGVGVGHAVGQQPEGIRGLIEGKVSVEIAQNDHMVW